MAALAGDPADDDDYVANVWADERRSASDDEGNDGDDEAHDDGDDGGHDDVEEEKERVHRDNSDDNAATNSPAEDELPQDTKDYFRPTTPPPAPPRPAAPASAKSSTSPRRTRSSATAEMSELERHFFLPAPQSPSTAASASSGSSTPAAYTRQPSLSPAVAVGTAATVVNATSPTSPLQSPPAQPSEWSHQQMVAPTIKQRQQSEDAAAASTSLTLTMPVATADAVTTDDDDWDDMPVFASHDIYDDDGNIVAHELPAAEDEDEEEDRRGGAGKGYTRVTDDEEEAANADAIESETKYLFNDDDPTDTDARNPLNQLRNTKDLLTDSQRIAYVGLCKLCMVDMATDLARKKGSPKIARGLSNAFGAMAMWAQKMSMRLYAHMELSQAEQLMIEQLSPHGVETSDLSPALMQNARVHNPMVATMASTASSAQHSPSEADSLSRASHETTDSLSSRATTPLPEYSKDVRPGEVQSAETLKDAKTIDIDVRWTVLCDLFLVLVADSIYDARSRTLLERVGQALEVTWLDIARFEKRITDAIDIEEASFQTWKEDDILEDRRKRSLKKKYIYMGLATLGGGLVIGLSAGLLAPVIGAGLAAGLSTIGIAGTSSFLAGAGGAAIVTTTGAAIGARIGNTSMANRMGHVQTFEFRPLHNNERVNLIITVSGWMSSNQDDVRLPFSTVDPIMGDLFSLFWEPDMLTSMGQTMNLLATEVLTQSIQQVLGSTMLVALMASLQLPMMLTKLSYLLDNPWNVSLDRAWSAGLILADTLIQRNLGVRPITLVGFSLGARVILSCLRELAKRQASGIVQNVYIFGCPTVVKRDQFTMMSTVVSGRFVNGYSQKDWILGYLFRATSGGLGKVAGLAPIEGIYGVENFDCTELVDGHMGYREAMPRLLAALGWEVVSEEFTEIEDPDPDLQRERQRELIVEFENARRQMEREAQGKKPSKNIFSKFLKPKKKEWWEMYEEAEQRYREQNHGEGSSSSTTGTGNSHHTYSPSTSSIPAWKTGDENYRPEEHAAYDSNSSDPLTFRPGEYHYQYQPRKDGETSSGAANGGDEVLFDVEAIRREIRRAKARGL
ncbi:uncharacterized protein V1518DRAFT_421685 [Limtongia smithiae]|uniref:uncharacterized protein n=1 Tax=Limtongia smithiae TaxID=1125753 RepID=UPI0034D016D3